MSLFQHSHPDGKLHPEDCVLCGGAKTGPADLGARDRIDRNEDGSLDDIVLMLEPDLMLRAEEMDDGQWWVAVHAGPDKNSRTVSIDLYKGDDGWSAQIGEKELLAQEQRSEELQKEIVLRDLKALVTTEGRLRGKARASSTARSTRAPEEEK